MYTAQQKEQYKELFRGITFLTWAVILMQWVQPSSTLC